MIRTLGKMVLCTGVLLSPFYSKGEQPGPIMGLQANPLMTKNTAVDASGIPQAGPVQTLPKQESPRIPANAQLVPTEDLSGFKQRLEQMKAVKRQPRETLLTSKTLLLDYDERFVRMDGKVKVIDDQGELNTESLIGRFSVSNSVESIAAKGGVELVSEGRRAKAESADFDYLKGVVRMEGLATLSEGGNRLSAERIRFWIRGNRKVVCEPNALLQIASTSGIGIEGVPSSEAVTEIRSNMMVYDESRKLVELDGNVRLRDARASLNCEKVHLWLKDDNKIDWIRASSGVIIKADGRRALADVATYYVDEGKFMLEGNPKVMQGQNMMTGDRITFWQKTRRMVCEPNARVLLYIDEATKAKFFKDLND